MGKLIGIAIKHESQGPMTELQRAGITLEAGVADDFRGKPGKRQVTVLSRESWGDVCAQLGQVLPWTTRRANLLVEGVGLSESIGSKLRVGGAVLEITGETKPCPKMDKAVLGLKDALVPKWRAGVTCSVVEPGDVEIGDAVSLD